MISESTAQKIIDDAYADDECDNEFIVHSAILIVALDGFLAMGARTGRDMPEFDIARGLRDYVKGLAASLAFTNQIEHLLEQASDSVAAYLAAADVSLATREHGDGDAPCDVEAAP